MTVKREDEDNMMLKALSKRLVSIRDLRRCLLEDPDGFDESEVDSALLLLSISLESERVSRGLERFAGRINQEREKR